MTLLIVYRNDVVKLRAALVDDPDKPISSEPLVNRSGELYEAIQHVTQSINDLILTVCNS